MDRLTEICWRNLDPWECCGQDRYCHRGCHDLGGCTGGCIVPKLYARLARYEDTGLMPEEVMELIKPPNDPLTLEELREMDGEPVWLEVLGGDGHWVMFCGFQHDDTRACFYNEISRPTEGYGKTWTAYRRKPEEGN